MPKSLDASLSEPSQAQPTAATDSSKPLEEAKKSQDEFSKDQRDPLSSNQPHHKRGITFAAQDKLPKLPIPDLDSSIKKYLAALKPLQTRREHAESKQAAEDFRRTDGPDLQEKLKKYATGKTSYIEQFCKSSVFHI